MKISIVIAAYNESETIARLTTRLISTLDAIGNSEWELIYVIEGTDGTRAMAESFAVQRREIRVLYQAEPSGLADAFRRGFDAVAPDVDLVVTMDADLNHQPEEIPSLVRTLLERGADVVVGSRKVKGSVTEGAPLWKRALSNAVNQSMASFMNVRVADMTSGYRVYRRDALRRITFGNTGFAFLPEILINAHALGLRIVEEPIQFVFRTAGKSKMALLPTARSYLALFAARPSALWSLGSILVLAAALAIRILLVVPVHLYLADADGILAGLCGREVIMGKFPLFLANNYRLGPQSCYIAAGFFSLFGISRVSLALTGLTFSLLFVVFMYLYFRVAFRARSVFAGLLLAAFPPLQLMINTYTPWGYGEILMYCASSLWLATLLEKRRPGSAWFFAFGLSVGLALWCSVQSIMITLPLILWLLLHRVLTHPVRVVWLSAGALIGSSPLCLFLASGGASRYFSTFAFQTAGRLSQIWSNALYLFEDQIPILFVNWSPGKQILVPIEVLALLMYVGGFAMIAVLTARPSSPIRRQPNLLSQVFLIALLALSIGGFYACSSAGSARGWTVRYVLPMYLAALPVAPILIASLKKRGSALVVIALLFLAYANIRQYPILSSPLRRSLETAYSSNEQMIRWLKQNHIQAVLGDYWDVYALNFDAAGSVIGVPAASALDYFSFADNLRSRRIRWALIGRSSADLVQWEERLGTRGVLLRSGPSRFLFIPNPNPPPGDAVHFLEAARAAWVPLQVSRRLPLINLCR